MKHVVSVSNARKDLPKMIREIEKDPEAVFEITVHNTAVAQLRSAKTMVAPGEAVRKLIRLRQRLSRLGDQGPKEPISKRVKEYLYASGRE